MVLKYLLLDLFLTLSFMIRGQQQIYFAPSNFANKFSSNIPPVLKIHEKDTIYTETIDASGTDKNGIKRARGGNPLTGPFFVQNAVAGDVLAITFTKISLNRSYAFTTEGFVSRSLPKEITAQFKKPKIIKWSLDRTNHFAHPDSAYEGLRSFKVPLNPFLGCVGVAPQNNKNEVLSFFLGNFGGNLDFSGLRQYATIYLPVFHDGGFLYFGDGHAEQGDGELAGNALETSMDIAFTIKIIKSPQHIPLFPRIEDPSYIMATGMDKSLDEAIKRSTQNLLDWLQNDYHLSIQEASQVISSSVEYVVAEIADPDVEIVAKIKKETIKGLKK